MSDVTVKRENQNSGDGQGNSGGHRRDEEHRPPHIPPKEPPGKDVRPRGVHGQPIAT